MAAGHERGYLRTSAMMKQRPIPLPVRKEEA